MHIYIYIEREREREREIMGTMGTYQGWRNLPEAIPTRTL